ncbi:hypothetical protein OOT00_14935 [Desulfobotulus sp. H1]|uniref:Glycosyltransferase n=1 Tax=Desulfobotulus pelophilus TaxID=2823377 RepID=A0ABT3NCZ1_9BACT|nr:hypothetical protein [Desulfobotulus pelophilus]MCW7755280.1 hypothetical protein [Desulfobotulus pelophilus]
MKKLFGWLYMMRHRKRYDFILYRHMEFDPFALFFCWFIPNRLPVYHAKTVQELKLIRMGWKGNLASALEKMVGRITLQNSAAIIGVTKEIAKDVCAANSLHKPALFYPNGIRVQDIPVLKDTRSKDDIHLAFVCGYFSPWHGLERLISAAGDYTRESHYLCIHLLGILSAPQIELLKQFRHPRIRFHAHGYLDQQEYLTILASCSAGIGSLALDLKFLQEASTLKVREYLAMGLPVIASHIDSALPEQFPYYRNIPVADFFDEALKLAEKSYDREEIRNAAKPYIGKTLWMNKLVGCLKRIKN